ncbi:MAG: hypothetical protein RBS80_14615 [Thermoguttaceae bacterium]|jgi:hypothetical protein|nr:hypothetical protein [Thermoguttaceae bacterium]
MSKARPVILPNDGHRERKHLEEAITAMTCAAHRYCQDLSICDAQIGLSLHDWQALPLSLDVRRWSFPSPGSPPWPERSDAHGHVDLRAVLTADLLKLMRLFSVHLGGQEFDLGFGRSVLIIRNGGLRRFEISRRILFREITGLESFVPAVRYATGCQDQKKRAR